MQTDYAKQVSDYNRATYHGHNTWVAASGGLEPVTEIDGYHYQMMFNPASKERLYYCYETDTFPDYEELPACLTGRG